ncbi:MAG TPA: hypothetical protein VFH31_04070, partial [Pyrinomonadaceae bacterium]|nr:hypothetical protein [Pyrinomonadaceae bacterium]
MFTKFFVGNLPPSITEPNVRSLLREDNLVSVSFRESPMGTVAMLETPTMEEAERASAELVSVKLGGVFLTVVAADTLEAHQLGQLFDHREVRGQRACGGSACLLVVDNDQHFLELTKEVLSGRLPDVC